MSFRSAIHRLARVCGTVLCAVCLVGGVPAHAVAAGWGALIGEPGLDAAIDAALDQSSSIAASRASTRVQAMRTRLARAARHPDIELTAAYRIGREKMASTGFREEDLPNWDVGGAARLDLDVFGALRAQTRGAHQAEQVAEFELRNQEIAWAAEMARVLVRLRYHQQEQQTREAIVDAHAVSRDWAQGRVEAGLLPANALEAYESRLLQARREQVTASENLALVEAQWNYLAGENPIPANHADTSNVLPGLPPEEELAGWVTSRPDFQAAYASWLSADYNAAATRKSRYPTLSAIAMAQGEGPSPVEDPDEWTAWAGLQLEFPLWAPDDKARTKRDREQARVEEALYLDTGLAALKDLQQAYARRLHAATAWELAAAETSRYQERLATAQRKFDQGLIMQTDLESTRTEWLSASDREARARTRILTHHLDLVQAGGGPR